MSEDIRNLSGCSGRQMDLWFHCRETFFGMLLQVLWRKSSVINLINNTKENGIHIYELLRSGRIWHKVNF